MIRILQAKEIALIKASAKVTHTVLTTLRQALRPGITGIELDQMAAAAFKAAGAKSNFYGYHSYPATICCSINSALVHGIPNDQPLQAGDIVGIDTGCVWKGWHSDAAFSAIVGQASSPADINLVTTTQAALAAAIKVVKPGIKLGVISATIQSLVEKAGFFLPTNYAGHGIGRAMHEDPLIPNVGNRQDGIVLKPGMVLCIEPMVQVATAATCTQPDGWTVVNASGQQAAHYEAMVLVTSNGHELLTPLVV